jgi:hypothetical protein
MVPGDTTRARAAVQRVRDLRTVTLLARKRIGEAVLGRSAGLHVSNLRQGV